MEAVWLTEEVEEMGSSEGEWGAEGAEGAAAQPPQLMTQAQEKPQQEQNKSIT